MFFSYIFLWRFVPEIVPIGPEMADGGASIGFVRLEILDEDLSDGPGFLFFRESTYNCSDGESVPSTFYRKNWDTVFLSFFVSESSPSEKKVLVTSLEP